MYLLEKNDSKPPVSKIGKGKGETRKGKGGCRINAIVES